MNTTYWPVLLRAGVELRTNCRVREIMLDEHGMASGVLYHDPEGRLQRQRAEVVVLACNGIGTPRLMLHSKSRHFPDGIANRSGLVGKNLMFHPLTGVSGVFDEPMEGFKGPIACSILSQEFYESDPSRDFVRGYGLHASRWITPMTWTLGGFGIDKPIAWGSEHRRLMDEIYPYSAALTVVSEDLPREANTVTLDPELTDSDGIPAPKITYSVEDNTRKMIAHGEARAEEALLAAGARQVSGRGPGGLVAGRMAPDGHGAHGQRSGALGGQWLGALPRRAQPLHRGRQHLRHIRRGEPHLDHPGAGALYRRQHPEEHRQPLRLVDAT